MLLTDQQKADLVNKIIQKARSLIDKHGEDQRDAATGFVHRECRALPFVLIEHQRQTLTGGSINTNGLDLWMIETGDAKKMLSVSYVPFKVKHFNKAGKAVWIESFLNLQI